MACLATRFIFRDLIGVGFVAGPTPCVGAAVTDGLLALHSISGAVRIGISGHHALSRTATLWTFCNTAWCASGALMWLVPSQSVWFESAWRLNAVTMAVFVFSSWLLVRASMGAIGSSDRTFKLLLGVGLIHGAGVCVSSLLPSSCPEFDSFIMYSGVSVSLPVQALIMLYGWLSYSHSLLTRPLSPHPLGLTVYAALAFVVAQVSMTLGRGTGPTQWLALLMPAQLGWEEAATMHVCCMVANEMFYRALAWMAKVEPPQAGGKQRPWLREALKAKH